MLSSASRSRSGSSISAGYPVRSLTMATMTSSRSAAAGTGTGTAAVPARAAGIGPARSPIHSTMPRRVFTSASSSMTLSSTSPPSIPGSPTRSASSPRISIRLIESMLSSASRSRSGSSISAGYPVRSLTMATTVPSRSTAAGAAGTAATAGSAMGRAAASRGAGDGGTVGEAGGAAPSAASTTSRWAVTICCMPRRYSATRTCGSSAPGTAAAGAARPSGGKSVAGGSEPGTRSPVAVRTWLPLIRYGARGGGADTSTATASRPENSASASTGTPAAASSASASRKRRTPSSPATSHATATWGASPRMRPTSWVRTRPGPASTNTRAPAAYMASIWARKTTGSATWRATSARTASGSGSYGAAVVLDHTGPAGAATAMPASRSASAADAAASRGVWNAHATGRRRAARPRLAQRRHGRLDLRGRARDHALVGGVVVGHDHRRPLGQRDPDVGHRAPHRGHGPRVVRVCGRQDRLAPGPAEGDQLALGERTRRRQGDQLAVAVAGGRVGRHPAPLQQVRHGQPGDAERRLRHPGVGERGRPAAPVGPEVGRREHGGDQLAVRPRQVPPQRREGHEQVPQHVRPLAALAGEQERHRRRGAARVGGEEHAAAGLARPGPGELRPQVVEVVGHERGADRGGRAPLPGRPGEVAQPPRPAGRVVGVEGRGEPVELGGRLLGGRPTHQEQLGRPVVEPVGGLVAAGVGRQHGVEVGPAEAERADRRPPLAGRPGPGHVAERERAGPGVVGLVGLVEVAGRGQHAAVQGAHGLDQAREAGGALGVADLGLHRPERGRPRGGATLGEHLGERGQLGAVADHRAGPVGLDQPDRGRGDARAVVGALQRPALALAARARSGRGCARRWSRRRPRSPRGCGHRRARRRPAA